MSKICYVLTIPLTVRSFLMPQLQYLSEHGFDVTVICSPDDHLQDELGIKIRFLPVEIPRGIEYCASIRAIHQLTEIFLREKFDMVQYSTPNAALYASIAAKISHIKVRNYHLMGFRYLGARGVGRSILWLFEKISCMLSTSIECVSESNRQMGIKEKLFYASKAVVVWNGSTGGVDLNRFDYLHRDEWRRQVRSELGYEAEDYVFGFVGRITRDKGINEILIAYLHSNINAKLLFVGDIEDNHNLDCELLQKARNHPNITFHQNVLDIERYYAAIDMLLLPSYREGFGNVIIEAAAVGTPAIVSDIPGPIDAIEDGKTAYVVPVREVGALMLQMNWCLKNRDEIKSEDCAYFTKTHFDSEVLCEKIFQRKLLLLGKSENSSL